MTDREKASAIFRAIRFLLTDPVTESHTSVRVDAGYATVSLPADALLDLLARVDHSAPVRPS